MFICERCGTTYRPTQVAGLESCPGCLIEDAVLAPLTFRVFSIDTLVERRHAVDHCRRASNALGEPATVEKRVEI